MKRILLLVCALAVLAPLAACGKKGPLDAPPPKEIKGQEKPAQN